ncbi:hypothetical protein [Paraburkholderia sp. MM5477-R1]|uniref:hypothetical protein n=1 Tax=Paraburkholderia sp. MM5477-R1 TaxID=2991062 RepID=UPI003D2258F2
MSVVQNAALQALQSGKLSLGFGISCLRGVPAAADRENSRLSLAGDRSATIQTGITETMSRRRRNGVAAAQKSDANDVLYWFESSWDYDAAPQLAKIEAPLYAVNFADDLVNATDLGVKQQVLAALPHAHFVEMPETAQSYGHMTLAHPEVWKRYLIELLASTSAASH